MILLPLGLKGWKEGWEQIDLPSTWFRACPQARDHHTPQQEPQILRGVDGPEGGADRVLVP